MPNKLPLKERLAALAGKIDPALIKVLQAAQENTPLNDLKSLKSLCFCISSLDHIPELYKITGEKSAQVSTRQRSTYVTISGVSNNSTVGDLCTLLETNENILGLTKRAPASRDTSDAGDSGVYDEEDDAPVRRGSHRGARKGGGSFERY